MRRVKVIFINLLMLTAASLILRTAKISFQVYLSSKLGPQGIGLSQLIISIYVMAIVLATSGIRFATTRLVAEEMGTGRPSGVLKAVHNCLIYAAILSIASMAALYLSSTYIGTCWLNDNRSVLSLRIFAFSLPFISISSVFKGYFIAVRKVIMTVAGQFTQQTIRIGSTIFFIGIFLPKGLEYACAAVVIGSCLAEVGSFLLLIFLYRTDSKWFDKNGNTGPNLLLRMFHIALPVAFSSYIVSIIRTVQQLLIPYGLKKSGVSSEAALSTYGVIRGMTMPILMFPSVLLDAISELIVPELAECKATNSNRRLNYIIARVFNLGILSSVCVTWIIMRFSRELGMTIYNNAEAAYFIKMLAPLIPFMYLDRIVDNMLKGIGEQVSSMQYNIVVSSINVALVYLLIPRYANSGYIAAIYFARILNFSLSINRLIEVTNLEIDINGILRSIFCVLGAISISDLFLRLIRDLDFLNITSLYIQLPLIVVIYLFLLRIFSCITQEDIIWIKSLFR